MQSGVNTYLLKSSGVQFHMRVVLDAVTWCESKLSALATFRRERCRQADIGT